MPKRKNAKTINMPMIPLRGLMIFPHMVLHFDVGRASSVASLEEAMMRDQKIFLVAQVDENEMDPGLMDLYHVGTIARIKQVVNLPGNNLRVLVEGIERA